jgi:GT2 family glycosyltransferase
MTPLDLSVVLPVYNVAPYLRQCLDSLANQERPAKEIIAVDDGSTDESPAILAEYAAGRLPSLNIIRQENGGLSAARNTGLRYATGKWLAFVDSDDFVAPSMFQTLVEAAERDDLDIALCNGIYHFDDKQPERPIYTAALETDLQTGRDWLKKRLSSRRILHMVWLHLYKRSFLTAHGLSFIPGRVHEDVVWTNQAFLSAKRVRYIDGAFYHYRIRQSRSGADLVRRSREYVIPCSIDNAMEIARLADTITEDEPLARLMRWQAFDSGNAVFHLINKLPSKQDRRQQLDTLWQSGFMKMMWKNAGSLLAKRKLIRHLIRKLLRTG